MIGLNLKVRPATLQDHQSISNLILLQNHAHRHLDWRHPLDWLGSPYFWLLEDEGRTLAVLACPPDPPGVAWMRLFAFSGQVSALDAWSLLWNVARGEIANLGGAQVAVIAMQTWMYDLLTRADFKLTQNIVMLEYHGRPVLQPALPPGMLLRPMTWSDLPEVEQIDSNAFDPLWNISLDSLQRAFSQSVVSSVVESGGRLLGYQLSTGKPSGAHLARLAVRKDAQGFGLGAALVNDLISQMRQRSADLISVNTQDDNHVSLSLYQKAGFFRTGEEYPVFCCHVGQGE
jgi:[ribosomal protein S18]-alanine N-acetyltransferase